MSVLCCERSIAVLLTSHKPRHAKQRLEAKRTAGAMAALLRVLPRLARRLGERGARRQRAELRGTRARSIPGETYPRAAGEVNATCWPCIQRIRWANIFEVENRADAAGEEVEVVLAWLRGRAVLVGNVLPALVPGVAEGIFQTPCIIRLRLCQQ